MLKRLRIKFVCITMLIVTAMLCVIFGLILFFTRDNLQQQNLAMLQTIAAQPPGIAGQTSPLRVPHFTLQVAPDGTVVAIDPGEYDLSDEAFVQTVLTAALSAEEPTGFLSAYNLSFYRVGSPYAQRIVFADISYERNTLEALWANCLLIGGVSFLAFLLLSTLLAHWAVKPVETAWKQQRQFVSDASHELKTPLTVLLTNAELLCAPDYDAACKARFAENVLAESQRMRGLVENLLEMARIDNAAPTLVLSQVNLSKAVADVVLPFEPVFFEKGMVLNSAIDPGAFVQGSETHLKQLTAILLDNAQKYAAPASETTLALKKHHRNRWLLSVANPGQAISPDELKQLFKRFYRADPARTATDSYGLGLAIAQSIAHMHHGKIWAESKNGVNTFFVLLPAQAG